MSAYHGPMPSLDQMREAYAEAERERNHREWVVTPWYLRMIGRPTFRYWKRGTLSHLESTWVYAKWPEAD